MKNNICTTCSLLPKGSDAVIPMTVIYDSARHVTYKLEKHPAHSIQQISEECIFPHTHQFSNQHYVVVFVENITEPLKVLLTNNLDFVEKTKSVIDLYPFNKTPNGPKKINLEAVRCYRSLCENETLLVYRDRKCQIVDESLDRRFLIESHNPRLRNNGCCIQCPPLGCGCTQ